MDTPQKTIEYRSCPYCPKGVMTRAGFIATGTLPGGQPRWVQQWRCERRAGCNGRTLNPGPPCDYDGNVLPVKGER